MADINTAEFMRAFDKMVERTERQYDSALRTVALQMFGDIVLRTPVDTGRARGNWQIDIDSVPSGEVGTAESWADKGSEGVEAPRESQSSRDATNKAQRRVGSGGMVRNYIAIANNLPYISKLEEGSSDQMPSGMVRVTLTEFERRLNEAARDNKL